MTYYDIDPRFVDIHNCSACGMDHKMLMVTKLILPLDGMGETFTHAGSCPETGDMLYVAFKPNQH